nr:GtrA family protein [uncultured Clostridium sp.]
MKKINYKETILYLFFGVCTTIINTAVYAGLYETGWMGNIKSNTIAWILAVLFAFITNKLWVFESKGTSRKQLLHEATNFFSCRIATGILDILIMYVGVNVLGIIGVGVKVSSNIIVILLNYVASKVYIFKGQNYEDK